MPSCALHRLAPPRERRTDQCCAARAVSPQPPSKLGDGTGASDYALLPAADAIEPSLLAAAESQLVREEMAERRKQDDARLYEEIERHRNYLSAVAAAEQRARLEARRAAKATAKEFAANPARARRLRRRQGQIAPASSGHRVVIFGLPYEQKAAALRRRLRAVLEESAHLYLDQQAIRRMQAGGQAEAGEAGEAGEAISRSEVEAGEAISRSEVEAGEAAASEVADGAEPPAGAQAAGALAGAGHADGVGALPLAPTAMPPPPPPPLEVTASDGDDDALDGTLGSHLPTGPDDGADDPATPGAADEIVAGTRGVADVANAATAGGDATDERDWASDPLGWSSLLPRGPTSQSAGEELWLELGRDGQLPSGMLPAVWVCADRFGRSKGLGESAAHA